MSVRDQLKLDCEEYKTLLSSATRPNVQQFLLAEITRLEKTIALESAKDFKEVPQSGTENSGVKEKKPKAFTSKLTSYGWDQTKNAVKIYITLKDVETVSAENIKAVFSKDSLDLTIFDLHGKNYSLTLKGLLLNIIPEESTCKVKSGTCVISLKKETPKSWEFLTKLEKRSKDARAPKFDKDADPQSSIMTMMKQMYEEGDDDMKRTIAKAWTESRDKQGMSPDLGI